MPKSSFWTVFPRMQTLLPALSSLSEKSRPSANRQPFTSRKVLVAPVIVVDQLVLPWMAWRAAWFVGATADRPAMLFAMAWASALVKASALLRAPHSVIPNHFGKDSAAAHRDLARGAGVPYSELPLPSLAIDLDRVEDVEALLRIERGAEQTRALLRELGFGGGP